MRKIVAGFAIIALFTACGGGGGASDPEAAVKGMFDAMKSGDLDAMAQYMPAEAREELANMSDEDKEMTEGMLSMFSAVEFNILGSEVEGETAVVTVEIDFMGQKQEEEIELMLEDGKWVVTEGGMF
ncbi:DUF4878 domain-containing protein [Candidatus Fermentibacterales bacterium]|nr:DUF4878 domain-containing protein [Candidatus Fermentibacterales bacterium]